LISTQQCAGLGDVGEAQSTTHRLRSAMPEIQTSMAWEGGEGSMEGQQTYGDTYGAEMSP